MTNVTFSRVESAPLADLSIEFGTGLHVVVGAEHDGTLALIELASGATRPRTGTVRVAGEDPHQNARLRRQIASSLGGRFEEQKVIEGLTRRARLHAHVTDPTNLLARSGLPQLSERPCTSLDDREHSSLMLALALDHAEPVALLLHEPLDRGTLLERGFVLSELKRHAEKVPVICTTARPELVSELSDTACWLETGRLRRATSPTTAPSVLPGVPPTLVVSCSDAPKLARALAFEQAVTQLSYQRDPGTVEVRGDELDALSVAICRAADSENVVLHQLRQSFPELPEVRAVHAAMARTAYERAYGVLSARRAEEASE